MSVTDCILVVDDNENHQFIVRRQLVKILQGTACQILEARHAEGALKRIDRLRSQGAKILVISDHKMAKMNGLELLRAVRAQGWSDVGFVLFSSTGDPQGFKEARELGALDAFEKPLALQSLRRHLNDAVMLWRGPLQEPNDRTRSRYETDGAGQREGRLYGA